MTTSRTRTGPLAPVANTLLVALMAACCLFATNTEASEAVTCGIVTINPANAICCNSLVYIRSGRKPACCGTMGYDSYHYMCCQGSIVYRSGGQPRCCGHLGYNAVTSVCDQGVVSGRDSSRWSGGATSDVNRWSGGATSDVSTSGFRSWPSTSHTGHGQTDSGATDSALTCCETEDGWRCCSEEEGCCGGYGSGSADSIDIAGFRPACCDMSSSTEMKAECCARIMETVGTLPQCCDDDLLRPVCCRRHNSGGSLQCCPGTIGYCCGLRNHRQESHTNTGGRSTLHHGADWSSQGSGWQQQHSTVDHTDRGSSSAKQTTQGHHSSDHRQQAWYLQARYEPHVGGASSHHRQQVYDRRRTKAIDTSGSTRGRHHNHHHRGQHPTAVIPERALLQPCGSTSYNVHDELCCAGMVRARMGVRPSCCGPQAYDAIIYRCCDGVVKRSCHRDNPQPRGGIRVRLRL